MQKYAHLLDLPHFMWHHLCYIGTEFGIFKYRVHTTLIIEKRQKISNQGYTDHPFGWGLCAQKGSEEGKKKSHTARGGRECMCGSLAGQDHKES